MIRQPALGLAIAKTLAAYGLSRVASHDDNLWTFADSESGVIVEVAALSFGAPVALGVLVIRAATKTERQIELFTLRGGIPALRAFAEEHLT